MRPRGLIGSLVAVAALTCLLAGCGSGGGYGTAAQPAGTPSEPAPDASSSTVRIEDFKFVPATLTVKPGVRVTVTNGGSTAHTATADDGRAFDTGAVDPGSSKAIELSKPGDYAYHCSIHSFMHGTIAVK